MVAFKHLLKVKTLNKVHSKIVVDTLTDGKVRFKLLELTLLKHSQKILCYHKNLPSLLSTSWFQERIRA